MKLKNLRLTQIIPYPNNPRINEVSVQAVAESIKRFGYQVPIVVNEGYVIVMGHTRFEALKRLGYKEVQCVVGTFTDEQSRQLRIVDNKVSERAQWDVPMLVDELRAVEGVNSTMAAFFASGELDKLMSQVQSLAAKAPTAEQIIKAGTIAGAKYQRVGKLHNESMQNIECGHCHKTFYVEKKNEKPKPKT